MQPAPVGWRPLQRRGPPVFVVIGLVLVLAFVAFVALSVVSAWQSFGGVSLWSVIAPFCGVFVILFLLLAAAATGAFGRRASLPPPPPVQQPMVPAGLEGPVALNCPNCGAPPEAIDRFGVATCTHCGARYLVR